MRSGINYTQIPGGRGGKFKTPKLQELYGKLFEEQFEDAHNAAADVDATARCFFEMLRQKIISPDELGVNPDDYRKFIEKNPGRISSSGVNGLVIKDKTSPVTVAHEVEIPGKTTSSENIRFCHLHVHTQYSILDGAAAIPGLLKKP